MQARPSTVPPLRRPDVIVASEVVYDESLFEPLLRTLLLFTAPAAGEATPSHVSVATGTSESKRRGSPRVLMATRRRAGAQLDSFLDLAALHFHITELPWVADGSPPMSSTVRRAGSGSGGGSGSGSGSVVAPSVGAAALARMVGGCAAMSKTRYAPLLYEFVRK